jgi:hypothetical protein
LIQVKAWIARMARNIGTRPLIFGAIPAQEPIMVNHTDATPADGNISALTLRLPTDPATSLQKSATVLQKMSETLLQNAVTLSAKQAELGQKLALESLVQWQDLTRVRGPEDFLQGEIALWRGQTERSIDLLRSYNDDVRQSCFKMFDAFAEAIADGTPTARPQGHKRAARNGRAA